MAGVALLIALYVVAYSSKTIAAYRTGQTYFDLATFEQGFWNATQGTLFFYSLEGELSRFGRHFSPIFFLLLPIYALHRDPSTLLVLQSLALGLAAIPLYLVARRRLESAPAALVFAALYLANPALHDVNTINEFHEIAFAVPLLFLAFYAVERGRWGLYGVAVVGTLVVKEDVALVVAALGLYVASVARRRWVGLATVVGSVAWFAIVVEAIMPALRGAHGPVPFPGYEYLGAGPFGIARGLVTESGEVLRVLTAPPKRAWLYWLLQPVAFLAILAPEVLLIAAPGILLVLASTYPPTYVIFERYVAPVLPPVFVATVVATDRLRRVAMGSGRTGAQRRMGGMVATILLLLLCGATLYAQGVLGKYPDRLPYAATPDPHAATAIAFARAIPEVASVTIEDHRWLAHAAHRRRLYFLSGASPDTDYLLVDRKVAPITNVPPEARERAIRRVAGSPEYVALRCEDGITLYARRDAYERDGPLFAPYRWQHDRESVVGDPFAPLGALVLRGYSLDPPVARPGEQARLTLYWQARRDASEGDYTIDVGLYDGQGWLVARHAARPQGGACGTPHWREGQIVRDAHPLAPDAVLPPGEYTIRVRALAPDGSAVGEDATLPLVVGR